jgi:hypothetical protein
MATNTFTNISSATTDGSIMAAVTARIIRVFGVAAEAGATATTLVFNSKGAGAGTAISMTFALPANGGFVLPQPTDANVQVPWFQTNAGEGLTATTGTGSTVGIQVIYDIFASPGTN